MKNSLEIKLIFQPVIYILLLPISLIYWNFLFPYLIGRMFIQISKIEEYLILLYDLLLSRDYFSMDDYNDFCEMTMGAKKNAIDKLNINKDLQITNIVSAVDDILEHRNHLFHTIITYGRNDIDKTKYKLLWPILSTRIKKKKTEVIKEMSPLQAFLWLDLLIKKRKQIGDNLIKLLNN